MVLSATNLPVLHDSVDAALLRVLPKCERSDSKASHARIDPKHLAHSFLCGVHRWA